MPDVPTVVVADDSTTVRSLVARLLTRAGFHVVEAVDGLDALAKIVLERPHLAVLDLEMPHCSGLEVLHRTRSEPELAGIPVIMLTASVDRTAAARALAAGAADYVRKPCDPAELVARVRRVADIRTHLDDLDRRSSTDPLTGLPNRRGLEPVLASLRGPVGSETAVIVVDLDHFKLVNDRMGHDAGDVVLRTVAGRLAGVAAPMTVSRWGGEEFVVVGRCAGRDGLVDVAERMRATVAATPITFEHRDELATVPVTVSVGGVLIGPDGDVDRAFARADAALYEAKAAGRNRVVIADDIVVTDHPSG